MATVVAFVPALAAAFRTLEAASPFFHAAWQRIVPGPGWPLPAALALVTAALFGTVPARLRPASLLAGAAAIALALPAGLRLPWWNGPIVDLVVVTAALFLAARRAAPALHVPAARAAALSAAASPSTPTTAATAVRVATSESVLTFVSQLVTAAVLSLHALIAGFGRPGTAAAVLTTFALLGVGLAYRAKRKDRPSAASRAKPEARLDSGLAYRARSQALRGVGLFVTLTTIPAIAWTTTAALDLSAVAQFRAVTVAIAVSLAPAALIATGWPAGTAPLAGQARPAGGVAPAGVGALAAVPVLVVALLGVTVAAPAGTGLEAYTISGCGLALALGLVTKGDHTPSWITYGPALIVGLLPSLVLVLTQDGGHLRRLLLGIAALGILLAGAKDGLRAPLLAGSGTLAVVALHEVGLVWDLVPRWIPLAAGGLLLVVLAATLEARRRDLARVRNLLGRMT